MKRTRILLATILPALAAPARAQLPPDLDYRTVESAHFRVTFAPGLETLARRAVTAAEGAREFLARTVSVPPSGRIDIVLVDNVDFSNGYSTPFPSNRVVIYARPPAEDDALGFSPDWLDFVVSHELTHAFQFERAGKVGRALRRLFGRVPLWYPLFPMLGTPEWSSEGLAVVVESGFTGMGRARGSNHEMIVRTAVLEDGFDRMDRLNENSPIWPGDQRWYIYGSLFLRWLEERQGPDVFRRLLNNTAGSILPPFLFFDHIASHTFGMSWDDAFADWRADLDRRYRSLADSLSAAGLTSTERIVTQGRWAIHPRVSPDGTRLAWAAEDGRDVTRTRVLDLATLRVVAEHRRNGLGALSWTPEGTLIVSQFEFAGPYTVLHDLYRVGPGGRRLTRRARLEDPDASRGADRILAVEQRDGANRLVQVDAGTGVIRPLTDARPGTLWALPRWSPDGARIAVSRWSEGGDYDVVILDATGRIVSELMRDAAMDMMPAWSPDGRHVVFSSDRSGIPNLYAADLTDPARPVLRQVTNVLTGAQFPEISPDGRWIYFSAYHADGYAIERIAFDPATWRAPSPLRLDVALPAPEARARSAAGGNAEARPYSPWRSLLPTAWLPYAIDLGRAGTFAGVAVSGTDLVGRHAVSAWAALDVHGSGRWEGFGRWTWAGLGNPVFSIEAGRRWDDLGDVLLPDTTLSAAIERDDVVGAYVSLVRRRFRSSASITAGIEREVLHRSLLDTDRFRLSDPRDALTNLVARASFANTRSPLYSISSEDGIVLAGTGRWTGEGDGNPDNPRGRAEYRLHAAAYRSLPFPGFAHHVLALRGNAFIGTGDGTGIESIGGVSGGGADLAGFGLGIESRLLPLRGFDPGVLRGNRAWSVSAEYRLPLALVGRRPSLSPVFIDRVSAGAFLDTGDAWCAGRPAEIYNACAVADEVTGPLLGAGAELVFDLGFAGITSARLRLGFASPVRGPAGGAGVYVQLGSSY
jgi:Tol biopolymer transport system component